MAVDTENIGHIIDLEVEYADHIIDMNEIVRAGNPVYIKDYEQLDNLPSINSVTLIGDKSFDNLGIASKEYATDAWNRAYGVGDCNILLDVYASSTDKVLALDDRLLLYPERTSTSMEFVAFGDGELSPDPYATHYLRIVEPVINRRRGIQFYENSTVPFCDGQKYIIGCYARCSSGSGILSISRSDTCDIAVFNLTDEWQWYETEYIHDKTFSSQISFTNGYRNAVALSGEPTNYAPIGTVDMCGFVARIAHDTDSDIPKYLLGEYESVKHRLQAKQNVNTVSFGFATDLHFPPKGIKYPDSEGTVNPYQDQARNVIFRMMKAFEKMSREVPLSFVCLGGDYERLQLDVGYTPTKQHGIDIINEVNDMLSRFNCPTVAIAGNHEQGYAEGGWWTDYNPHHDNDPGLSYSEFYGVMGVKYPLQNRGIKRAGAHTFYLLDDTSKIAFLFLSTFYPPWYEGQRSTTHTIDTTGMDAAIAANTNDYPWVVFNHFGAQFTGTTPESVSPTIADGTTQCIDYMQSSDRSRTATVIAWINGHCHAEWCNVYNNVVLISCGQSGYTKGNRQSNNLITSSGISQDGTWHVHRLGTPSESEFTIFTINKNTHKIYTTNFGAGTDREFNYLGTSGTIGLVT